MKSLDLRQAGPFGAEPVEEFVPVAWAALTCFQRCYRLYVYPVWLAPLKRAGYLNLYAVFSPRKQTHV